MALILIVQFQQRKLKKKKNSNLKNGIREELLG